MRTNEATAPLSLSLPLSSLSPFLKLLNWSLCNEMGDLKTREHKMTDAFFSRTVDARLGGRKLFEEAKVPDASKPGA